MATARRALGQATAQMVEMAAMDIAAQFSEAVRTAGYVRSRQLIVLGEVFANANNDAAARSKMFTEMGRVAQMAVIDAYEELVEGQEGAASASHYRSGAGRLAGGVLRRALADPRFFEADANGIRFINTNMLDQEAAHWHRIAFGASESGEGSHFRASVSYGSMTLAAMGIDERPSPSFMMPPGFWIGGEGDAGAFYPITDPKRLNGRRWVLTKGIVGKPFLEAGITSIAHQVGPAIDHYYRDAFRRFRGGSGPFTGTATAPSRPNPAFRGRFTVT